MLLTVTFRDFLKLLREWKAMLSDGKLYQMFIIVSLKTLNVLYNFKLFKKGCLAVLEA